MFFCFFFIELHDLRNKCLVTVVHIVMCLC